MTPVQLREWAEMAESAATHWKDRAERAEAALADAERKIGRLKFHAEAMADALSAWVEIEVKEVAAYRAEFKEG